jgi:hypothetical protein
MLHVVGLYSFIVVWVKVSKGIPVTGRGGPYGCEMLRFPLYLDNRLTDGGNVVSPTRRPPFTPKNIPRILISVRC